MLKEHEMRVMGTGPPFSCFDYLTQLVQYIFNGRGFQVAIRHMGYTEEEARQFAPPQDSDPGSPQISGRSA
ncbi:MAG: hypothetical protein WHX93_17660 [bacterium]